MSNPEQLLEELCASATPRTCRSLKKVHHACKLQYEVHKSKDFSVAGISKLIEDRTPSEQAIRNVTGKHFRALITCWANYTGGKSIKTATPHKSEVEQALYKINDVGLRSLALSIHEKYRKIEKENRQLRNMISEEMLIDRSTRVEKSVQEVLPAKNAIGLTEPEIDALRAVEKVLEENGWVMDINGSIKNDKGRTLFRAGFGTAINKVLSQI